MIPGELKIYDGTEIAHEQFYIYIAAMQSWFSSFRCYRKHDIVPCVFSSPKRAYFESQLARYGMTLLNGQIPTPIISFWLSDYQLKIEREKPRMVKYYNRHDRYLYEDMIPYDLTFEVIVWTKKQADMFEIMSQIQRSFEQSIHWIFFKDQQTQRTQTAACFLEGISDSSNIEPGDKDDVMWKKNINIRVEAYIPRNGYPSNPVKKIYIGVNTGDARDDTFIEYISGDPVLRSAIAYDTNLSGHILVGDIAFSGTVSHPSTNEETFVVENYQW